MTSLQTRGKPWAAFTATALALSIMVTGCAPSATEEPTEEATAEVGPVPGGVATVVTSGDPNPQLVLAGDQANWSWQMSVFETLTVFDETSTPQPLLASSWNLAPDALSIEITLQDNVTFHSGRAMTAEDVKFSIESSLDPLFGSQLAVVAKEFTAINVTSDTTMTIEFAKP